MTIEQKRRVEEIRKRAASFVERAAKSGMTLHGETDAAFLLTILDAADNRTPERKAKDEQIVERVEYERGFRAGIEAAAGEVEDRAELWGGSVAGVPTYPHDIREIAEAIRQLKEP